MGTSDRKSGKLFIVFAVLAVLALPLLIFKAFSVERDEAVAEVIHAPESDFDHHAGHFFETYTKTTPEYMAGTSTTRTLVSYYDLRQYPGSPPYIPHALKQPNGVEYVCLSCHEKGGYANEMGHFTPVTPHPENTYCRQCHMKLQDVALFMENEWVSVRPPRLGRSALPGSPPPIAHPLQMRENCIACHVGPGTVVPIRVEHPMRGNCRQCHVPRTTHTLFHRESQK